VVFMETGGATLIMDATAAIETPPLPGSENRTTVCSNAAPTSTAGLHRKCPTVDGSQCDSVRGRPSACRAAASSAALMRNASWGRPEIVMAGV
jgi:hypothetical protein